MIRFIYTIFLSGLSLGIMSGQANTMTEEEVMSEDLFIQALQEKILGNTDKAITLFERITKEDDSNDAAFYQLSQLYVLLDKIEDAQEALQKAANIDPSNLYYQNNLADIFEKQNQYAQAAALFEKLYSQGYYDEDLLDRWYAATVQIKDYDQAMQILDHQEEQNGPSAEIARERYELYMAVGKPKKGERVLLDMLKEEPENLNVLYFLAMHYKTQNDGELSEKYFKRILEIDPDNSKANIALANNFRNDGQDQQFLNSISSIIQNPQINVDLKIKELLPYIEKSKDQPDEGLLQSLLVIAEDLRNIHPNSAKVYALSGDLHYQSGQIDLAVENYQQAINIQPEIWSVWEHLFYLLAENNNQPELIIWTDKGKDYFPNQALVYYMSGIAQAKLGNFDDAISELDESSLMVGKNIPLKIDIYALKGAIYQRLNQPAEAIKWLKEALALNPDHVPALNSLAQALLDREDFDTQQVHEIIEQGLRLQPDYLALIASKGRLLYLTGSYDEAKDWLEKALNKQGNTDTAMLEVLGDTYFQLNQVEQAVDYWQKALDLNSPNHHLLQQKIENKSLIK